MTINGQSEQDRAQLRWGVYCILIALAAGSMIGRILSVDSVDYLHTQKQFAKDNKPRIIMRPFLSSNDRSRWCTIRSLAEFGTYEIDPILFTPESLKASRDSQKKGTASNASRRYPKRNPGWDTIDKVRHKNRDGEMRFYSSKPPLLPTLLAGEYWLISALTGATLEESPYDIARFMLITVNVIPLILAFVLLAKMVERLGTTDWGRIFVMAAATFATFLTTFSVVINNHIPAAVSVTVAMYAAVKIIFDDERRLRYFAMAGFFAAFTAANELPALSFLVALAAALLWKAPKPTLSAFLPAALVVVAAFFGTNKIAHDSWLPPYAHRSATVAEDNWYDYEHIVQTAHGPRVIPSYWKKGNPVGVDRGESCQGIYALNVLAGHHGIFSLTPVWLLSLIGTFWMCRNKDRRLLQLAVFVAAITAVCLTFYLLRPLADRNYGGVTSGFRWMFWFAPLWLLTMIPAADKMSQVRWKRGLALTLLAFSVLSVSYPTWNPWTHPWIYQYFITYTTWG